MASLHLAAALTAALLALLALLQQQPAAEASPMRQAGCRSPCRCRPGGTPLRCPGGEPPVPDKCGGCCTVCPKILKQRGQPCSQHAMCDQSHGLVCLMAPSTAKGVCEYEPSVRNASDVLMREPARLEPPRLDPCEFDGVLRQDGEQFRVGCEKHCWCTAGAITCVSACPPSEMQPSDSCPEPRLVAPPPGECCKRWVCGQPESAVNNGKQTTDEMGGHTAMVATGRARRDLAAATAALAPPRPHPPPGSCEFRGLLHLDGERFRVGCEMYCSCYGGAMGCVPACPQSAMLPSASCPEPRLAPPPPGQCCRQWVCGQPAAGGGGKHARDVLGGHTAMAAFRQEDTMVVVAPPGGSSSGSDSPPPGGPAGPAVGSAAGPAFACEMGYSSEWSACSRSCGAGISTRVSTENPRCRMERQVRACVVRPCDLPVPPPRKPGKRCARTFRAPSPVRLRDPAGPGGAACVSLRRYRPRYCGACSDGRCCTPHRTLTRAVRMRCAGGRVVLRDVMVVRTCACHRHCPDDGEHRNGDNEV